MFYIFYVPFFHIIIIKSNNSSNSSTETFFLSFPSSSLDVLPSRFFFLCPRPGRSLASGPRSERSRDLSDISFSFFFFYNSKSYFSAFFLLLSFRAEPGHVPFLAALKTVRRPRCRRCPWWRWLCRRRRARGWAETLPRRWWRWGSPPVSPVAVVAATVSAAVVA